MITFLGLIGIIVTLGFAFMNGLCLVSVWQYLIPVVSNAPYEYMISSWYLLFVLALSIIITAIYIVILIGYWVSLHWKSNINNSMESVK